MTSADPVAADVAPGPSATPVFFLSDSTGISAETMGNALLIQFPELRFERTLIPFITTVEEAREVVASARRGRWTGPVTPLVFTTAATDEIREELHTTQVPDHRLLRAAHERGWRRSSGAAGCTGRGPAARRRRHPALQRRMAAIEYAIEHDDGQSLRGAGEGRRRSSSRRRGAARRRRRMYLALQHGLFVANYPLVDEDLETTDLPAAGPAPPRPLLRADRPRRRGSPRSASERRPNSRYASLEQCTYELRRAEAMYRGQPASGHQLLDEVGRGDVHPHRPDPAVSQWPR